MQPCSYVDFIASKQKPYRNIPRGFISEAIKDIPCRTAFAVYMLLYDLAELPYNKEHTVTISHNEIAKRINASPRTSLRASSQLQELGYIEIVHQGSESKGYLPNKIKVRFPDHLMKKLLEEADRKPQIYVIDNQKNLNDGPIRSNLMQTEHLNKEYNEPNQLLQKYQEKCDELKKSGLSPMHASLQARNAFTESELKIIDEDNLSYPTKNSDFYRQVSSKMQEPYGGNDLQKNTNNGNNLPLLTIGDCQIKKETLQFPTEAINPDVNSFNANTIVRPSLSEIEIKTIEKKIKAMYRDKEIHPDLTHNIQQLISEVIFHVKYRSGTKTESFKHSLNAAAQLIRQGLWSTPKRLKYLYNTRLERESEMMKQREIASILGSTFLRANC